MVSTCWFLVGQRFLQLVAVLLRVSRYGRAQYTRLDRSVLVKPLGLSANPERRSAGGPIARETVARRLLHVNVRLVSGLAVLRVAKVVDLGRRWQPGPWVDTICPESSISA